MTQYDLSNSRVIESREGADGNTIRRRRESPDGTRFTTYERVERANLAVIKKNGTRELYDREKLLGAIEKSVGKFFDSEIEIQEIVDNVEEAIYSLGEPEITSKQIGDNVLDQLAERNEV